MKVGSSANLNQIYKNDIKNKKAEQTEQAASLGKVDMIKEQLDTKEYKIDIQQTAEKMADKLL